MFTIFFIDYKHTYTRCPVNTINVVENDTFSKNETEKSWDDSTQLQRLRSNHESDRDEL